MKWFKKEIFWRVEAPEVAVVTIVTEAKPRLIFFFFLHGLEYQSFGLLVISNLGRSVFPVYGY